MERRNDIPDLNDNSEINFQIYLEELEAQSITSVRRSVYRLFTRAVVSRFRRGTLPEETKVSHQTVRAHANLRKVAQAASFLNKLRYKRSEGGLTAETNRKIAIAEILIEKSLKRGAFKSYALKLGLL
mmetsp:Transcript_14752/g.27321  ORF Transcript_14752/g.27321 Transcript_14752/m.27321 type:complete len:128 (-) Transcript_14752:29-412(-)